ncbi:F-box protein|nr:F-box protein [Noviherbaspirillum sp. L7-7A]
MDFSCAATATHGAAPDAANSNPNLLLDPNTGGSPRPSTRQPESCASLLLDELIGEVLQHLPLDDLASADQVCRRWHAAQTPTGWVTSAQAITRWSIMAGLAPMSTSAFHQALQQACSLSIGCRGEALERLAASCPVCRQRNGNNAWRPWCSRRRVVRRRIITVYWARSSARE